MGIRMGGSAGDPLGILGGSSTEMGDPVQKALILCRFWGGKQYMRLKSVGRFCSDAFINDGSTLSVLESTPLRGTNKEKASCGHTC